MIFSEIRSLLKSMNRVTLPGGTRFHSFILLFTVIFLFLGLNSKAQQLSHKLDSLMQDFNKQSTPGTVVAVYKDGEISFSRAYGMANLTHSVPISLDTKFNLGSVSKQFTAFAIALLAQRDSLSLDDPVQKYIPEIPEFDQEVSIRHLLTHTSGLRETYGPSHLKGRMVGEDRLTRKGAIEVVKNQPDLEFSPGSEFQYNSSAYVLLAEIVERISGQSFSVWMRKNIFQPLGMKETVIEEEIEQVIPGAADSYYKAENGYVTAFSNRAYYGAADIYTTLADIGRWLDNFHTGKLGGMEIQRQMQKPYVLTTGDTISYGLGLMIDEFRGLKKLWHGGSHAGYRAYLSYFPEINSGVMIMKNAPDVPSVDQVVEDIAIGDKLSSMIEKPKADRKEVKIDSTLLKRYSGVYKGLNGIFTIQPFDGKLSLSFSGKEFFLTALSNSLFYWKDYDLKVIFENTSDESIKSGIIRGEKDHPFRKINMYNYTADEKQDFVGRYYSPELNSFQKIGQDDSGALIFESPGKEPEQLRNLDLDNFSGREVPFDLNFKRDDERHILGYYISIGRTRNIWFGKIEEDFYSIPENQQSDSWN